MSKRLLEVGLLAVCTITLNAQIVQSAKVTFDEFKGQSQPTYVSYYIGDRWGTITPEGGLLGVHNGTFYTNCRCVPDDSTTVYGIIGGYTSNSADVSVGPEPVPSASFKLINGAARDDTYDIQTLHHYKSDELPYDRYYYTNDTVTVPAMSSIAVNVPGPDISSFGISPTHETYVKGGWRAFIDDVEWTFTKESPVKTALFAEITTPSPHPPAKVQKDVSSSMRMRIALGTVFRLGLQQQRGSTPPNEAGASIARVAAVPKPTQPLLPTANVAPRAVTMFPSDTLISIGDNQFLAVHLGTQTFNIVAPAASGVPTINLTVEVIPPTALGTVSNSQDYYLAMVAHNTGIVPQLVKGQVLQETGAFKPLTFRYEPCGEDVQSVSGGARRAFTDDYYKPFRLDDAIGVNLISHLRDDLDPRSRYFVVRDGQDRRLTDDDRGVTAAELWDDNDKTHATENWSDYCAPSVQDLIDADDSTELDFVAQTVLASSYGFQQVMWHEAVDPSLWDGVAVTDIFGNVVHYKAPKYLFDRPEYINMGGGSVQIGLNKISLTWMNGFRRRGHPPLAFADSFASVADFESTANVVFKTYNWAYRERGTGKPYGQLVVEKSHIFWPVQSETVFQ